MAEETSGTTSVALADASETVFQELNWQDVSRWELREGTGKVELANWELKKILYFGNRAPVEVPTRFACRLLPKESSVVSFEHAQVQGSPVAFAFDISVTTLGGVVDWISVTNNPVQAPYYDKAQKSIEVPIGNAPGLRTTQVDMVDLVRSLTSDTLTEIEDLWVVLHTKGVLWFGTVKAAVAGEASVAGPIANVEAPAPSFQEMNSKDPAAWEVREGEGKAELGNDNGRPMVWFDNRSSSLQPPTRFAYRPSLPKDGRRVRFQASGGDVSFDINVKTSNETVERISITSDPVKPAYKYKKSVMLHVGSVAAARTIEVDVGELVRSTASDAVTELGDFSVVLRTRGVLWFGDLKVAAAHSSLMRVMGTTERSLLSKDQYDLPAMEYPAPDKKDSKYLRHTAQNIGLEEFNGLTRPVRRVTISGVQLTLNKKERLVQTYSGQEDIKELYLLGDTIVISTPLLFPQTNVYIFARELRFEYQGEEPYIDTQPKGALNRDPLQKNGRAGAKAGSIHLYISKFTPCTDITTQHFRAAGQMGQAPDSGGVEASEKLKHLTPITQEDWNTVFSYEHRKVIHEIIMGEMKYESVLPYPSWETFSAKYGKNIVYVELNNRYYLDSFHIKTSGVEVVASAGVREGPGEGGNARVPGKPGIGGAGGDLKSTVPILSNYFSLPGGKSGARHPGTLGGPGGEPDPAYWLVFSAWPNGAKHNMKGPDENHPEPEVTENRAKRGQGSGLGPEPDSPRGKDGGHTLLEGRQYVWLVPTLLNIVLQYAKDCVITGHGQMGQSFLKPYEEALASGEAAKFDIESMSKPAGLAMEVLGNSTAFLQLRDEMKTLAGQATACVDYFGNPPGWVPSLSLESAVGIYQSVLNSSIQELYNAYVLERAWNEKRDKAAVLNNLIEKLTEKTKAAHASVIEGRKKIRPLMDDLKQLVTEMEDISKKLAAREEELQREADAKAITEEQKQAVAAGLKISGALLKALPLPEPAQSIAGAAGTALDITSNFVEGGASDEAFTALKDQVGKFADKPETLALFTQDIEDDLKSNNTQTLAMKQAADDAKQKSAEVDKVYGEEVTELENQKKLEETYLNLKKQEQELIEKKTVLTSPALMKIQDALTAKKIELDTQKLKVKTASEEVDRKKTALETQKAVLDQKKKEREAEVKTRIQQVKNIASSIETIGKTVNKLLVSKTQLNAMHDKILAGLKVQDSKFVSLVNQIANLGTKKQEVTTALLKTQTDLAENGRVISKNLVMCNELRAQLAKANQTLDPSVLAYVQSISQDAHRDLQQFLYYVVKAYEYYMVQPWKQSYLDAQKMFEDLRRVLEPSQFKYDFDDDPKGDQQKKLQALLQQPASEGRLNDGDFEQLKMVYEKPLRDMGKELANQLMRGSAKLTDTAKPVTLGADYLKDLNDRIVDDSRTNAIPFSLLQLRQIESSRERQRIRNIRIRQAKAQRLGDRFPDQVIFKFTHVGKSVVRADGKFYGFEPEGAKSPTGKTAVRVTFETDGGRRGAGWLVANDATTGLLQGANADGKDTGALWQPTVKSQANLLTVLLNGTEKRDGKEQGKEQDQGLISLSAYRPGAFSDFLFTVEFQPSEARVQFTELLLEIEIETGDAPVGEVLVSVRNNLDLAIPIVASQVDKSGRTGGLGSYIGIYDDVRLSANPVRLTVPEKFGELTHTGWLKDGKELPADPHFLDVAKSSFIVANYGKK